jgi:hypothetical protein
MAFMASEIPSRGDRTVVRMMIARSQRLKNGFHDEIDPDAQIETPATPRAQEEHGAG